jgi:hypothetical protein
MPNAPARPNARLPAPGPSPWPSQAELAALRAFHSGLSTRAAVERYAPQLRAKGVSARGVLGRIRRSILAEAARRHRRDLVGVLERAGADASLSSRQLQRALDALAQSQAPVPKITDAVAAWFDPRIARALAASSIETLAELTVRIPRLRGCVAQHPWPGCDERARDRSVLRREPEAHRGRARAGAPGAGGSHAVGAAAGATGSRRLARGVPRAAEKLHSLCQERLRGGERLVGAAGIRGDAGRARPRRARRHSGGHFKGRSLLGRRRMR